MYINGWALFADGRRRRRRRRRFCDEGAHYVRHSRLTTHSRCVYTHTRTRYRTRNSGIDGRESRPDAVAFAFVSAGNPAAAPFPDAPRVPPARRTRTCKCLGSTTDA